MVGSTGGGIKSVFAAIHTGPVALRHPSDEVAHHATPRFVTISREGGAGGHSIGQLLISRLNALDPGERPWTLWDRELVERVCADHHLAADLVDAMEEKGRTWMEDFLAGLSFEGDPTEARIYGLVAATIRTLARQGRAIIVGRGGVYITRNMPGGTHLRLVAPRAYRVHSMAQQLKLSHEDAMAHVERLDRQRATFFRRYWPTQAITADAFTLTINTSMVSEERAVETVIPLILPSAQAVLPARRPEPLMVVI